MLKRFLIVSVPLFALMFFASLSARPAEACGGLFCQNSPVDQAGERIVFTVNDNDTITSLIEIQYTGSAPDFSWILPIPEAITADDLAVPEEGESVFAELHRLTDVRIIAPPVPECAQVVMMESLSEDSAEESGVEVFASGEVGPFGFDVIGSSDPMALITWLRDNNYRVEPPMEPLINVYVEEEFAFIAMRLLDGESAESIKPIEITYPGQKPMIPLRLTAVAANNNMPIFTWVFADAQAVPENFEHMQIATEEITFSAFGSNNYRRLVQNRANALGGRAFITEFAAPANTIELGNAYLQHLAREQGYLTRLTTYISPSEMTVDPIFKIEQRPDVSNVRDASQMTGLYDCQRDNGESLIRVSGSDAIDPVTASGEIAAETPNRSRSGIAFWIALGAVVFVLVGFVGWRLGQRSGQSYT
ncbi:MAG: hypothetical protein ACI9EW_004070 [Cellvibrionaceae bacterium]|jgi:hypothetical protein